MFVTGSERSPGEGNGKPFQYSYLENPIDRRARWATVHGVARVRHNLATKQQHLQTASQVSFSQKSIKSLLMKVKVESVKAGLKLNIHKTKIIASSPITSWQIDEEKIEK